MNHKSECRIFLVDDDESVRRSISLLLLSAGYVVESYETVTSFLESAEITGAGCILLDIFLGKESGLNLQDAIRKKFPVLPIIYITGHGDIPMSVQAIKKGAFDFLQKPIDEIILFRTVEGAVDRSRSNVEILTEKNLIQQKINSLTPREYEILRFILKGMLNKQIAAELNITEHTVKLHRAKITMKLGVKSVSEIIYLVSKLDIRNHWQY